MRAGSPQTPHETCGAKLGRKPVGPFASPWPWPKTAADLSPLPFLTPTQRTASAVCRLELPRLTEFRSETTNGAERRAQSKATRRQASKGAPRETEKWNGWKGRMSGQKTKLSSPAQVKLEFCTLHPCRVKQGGFFTDASSLTGWMVSKHYRKYSSDGTGRRHVTVPTDGTAVR